jgi:outer membrane lipoprotein-sorting protein
MKKIILFVLLLMFVLLTACGNSGEESSTYSDITSEDLTEIGTVQTEGSSGYSIEDSKTNTSTEVTVSVSAKLASMTNEDGTGKISIHSDINVLVKKLDELKISYTNEKGQIIRCNDGTTYYADSDGLIREVLLMQTSKGLKVGDDVKKMKELYGDAELKTDYIGFYYVYTFSNKNQFQIVADGKDESAKITYISVAEDPMWGIEPEAGE